MSIPFIAENDQTLARRDHLEALRQLVGNVYPNKFERSRIVEPGREDTITAIVEKFRGFESNEDLHEFTVRLAGRIASPPRVMGKAAFVHLADGVSRLQIYIRKSDAVGIRNDGAGGNLDAWSIFQLLDHGDFIGVEGFLFVTRTGELSVHVQKLQFLSKALLPLPDKMHGIHDPEIRQRQRYADLIAGSLKLEQDEALTPREVFERRAAVIKEMRRMLEDRGYIEVETPMLTPLATSAAARQFKTLHNTLDIDLYARISPELYLKRLLVGGFEKVYELNRIFRNEGISTRHNPEFTMLELYCAYADVNQMMDFCEQMLRAVVFTVLGHTHVKYGEYELDFDAPFRRIVMRTRGSGLVARLSHRLRGWRGYLRHTLTRLKHGRIQPTFITGLPKSISPLSKASLANPEVVERFQLHIAGISIADGFSDLNDPVEQYERFQDQVKQREQRNEEARLVDEDYIRALSYGMPPSAGIGIGIDRLVMLLTNKHSIRDVILFPHMRPRKDAKEE